MHPSSREVKGHSFIQKKKGNSGYKGKNFDVSKVKCFNCQKMGHFAKDCWSKKKRNFKGKHHASTTAEEKEDSRKKSKGFPSSQERRKDYHLVSTLSGSIVNSRNTCLIDSGASRHITSYKDVLSNFKKGNFIAQVELGDEANYAMKGIGSISFQLKGGVTILLDEVLYVLGLKVNLISIA